MFCIRKLGVRCILYALSLKFYKVNALGVRHLPIAKAALLVGNYTSALDWAIFQMTSPRPVYCILENHSKFKWYLSFLYRVLHIKLVHDWKNRTSQHYIRMRLKQKHCVALLIPDKLSEHAHVGMFDSTIQSLATSNKTPIIPFYLYGLWQGVEGLTFHRKRQPQSPRTVVVGIAYGKPLTFSVSSGELNTEIIKLSIHAWKTYTASLSSIPVQWLKRFKTLNSSFYIADALVEQPFSAQHIIALTFLLKNKLKNKLEAYTRIGTLLPPSVGGILAMLLVLCMGKTLVSLNYTLGESFILKAIKKSDLKVIISSRVFIQALKKRGLHLKRILAKHDIIYLDDILKNISPIKVFPYLMVVKLLPFYFLKKCLIKEKSIESIAAILFSSGSEGEPKGIKLSHRNILGNAKQIFSAIGRNRDEVMLSALPIFHAFGLTVTTIVPLVEGISMVCCPDPTNVKQLSEIVYHHHATILCSIPSLLGLYARNSNLAPIMFKSLRLVIAGAEKLSPKIRRSFKQKFGIDLYEGYGATEVSPVASVNLPNILYQSKLYVFNKPGTVGLPLPGSDFCIIDPQKDKVLSLNHFGLILIGGTQVMCGYLNDVAKTKQVLHCGQGLIWYRSGDKGKLDDENFLTIVDRYSRMIKVAGESISLSTVEAYVEYVLKSAVVEVIAIGVPDARKGECIALLHSGAMSSEKIQHCLLQSTMAPLMQPTYYVSVCAIPKLGNGKKDYVKAKQIVLTDLKSKE